MNNPYMKISLELVQNHITKEAVWTATSILNTDDGLDPEVDLMVLIRAVHELATRKGVTKVLPSLEEAFDCAYDAFIENNHLFETDELCDDEHTWL